jgi:peptidoglycan/xylan/chitin deacetylase (PgdA/CDA1 family)
LLQRGILTGFAALAGGAVTHAVDGAVVRHATPESFRSTVAGSPGRGSLEVVWSAPHETGARIALCFDDGPTPEFTPGVLDQLARARVRATFFVIGALVDRHPDLVRRALDEGHELQNHSYDHNSAAVLGAAEVRESMVRGADALHRLGVTSTWYRPPRGEVTTATLRAAQETGHRLALWSVGRDRYGESADGDVGAVASHLRQTIRPGDIVDLHDGVGRSSFSGLPDGQLRDRRRTEIAALPDVLGAWRDAGLELVTLSTLTG